MKIHLLFKYIFLALYQLPYSSSSELIKKNKLSKYLGLIVDVTDIICKTTQEWNLVERHTRRVKILLRNSNF